MSNPVYISSNTVSQAVVTVSPTIAVPGVSYTMYATNPQGVQSNKVTFTVTNVLSTPGFNNPGAQTFVGGGSITILQTSVGATGLTWTLTGPALYLPGVTFGSQSDSGVTLTVSNGIFIPTSNFTLRVSSGGSSTSQTFSITNTFNPPIVTNPGAQSFTNGGSFSVTQTNSSVGQLSWSINPTTYVTLSNQSTSGVTVTVANQTLSAVSYSITATNPTPTSCVQTFTISNTSSIKAVGGTVTTSGTNTIHTFTTGGSFVVYTSITCQVLIIGGGGGGGTGQDRAGGGGGAGGYVYYSSQAFSSGSYTVTVGLAGAGSTGTANGGNGGNSSVTGLTTAVGGGGGEGWYTASSSGGSGGGGGQDQHTGGSGTAGQGNNGGAGQYQSGGGGGGAGSAGSDGVYSGNGGAGGDGVANSISGASQTYCGGGGGGTQTSGTAGSGGAGGGGPGGTRAAGNNATYYGGGGGGGGSIDSGGYPVTWYNGGNGYQGIVIISYPT
jgi:hypothetical protein